MVRCADLLIPLGNPNDCYLKKQNPTIKLSDSIYKVYYYKVVNR